MFVSCESVDLTGCRKKLYVKIDKFKMFESDKKKYFPCPDVIYQLSSIQSDKKTLRGNEKLNVLHKDTLSQNGFKPPIFPLRQSRQLFMFCSGKPKFSLNKMQ